MSATFVLDWFNSRFGLVKKTFADNGTSKYIKPSKRQLFAQKHNQKKAAVKKTVQLELCYLRAWPCSLPIQTYFIAPFYSHCNCVIDKRAKCSM